jgi:sugar lactone lactonase YvrE
MNPYTGAAVITYDLGDTESGFGNPTALIPENPAQIFQNRSDSVLQLRQYFANLTGTEEIEIQMIILVVVELGVVPGAARIVQATGAGRITLADSADGLIVPAGLAATQDDLWVSDWATGKVWLVVDNGVPLPSPALVVQGLSNPEGLAVDLDGSLLVVEAGAGRLSRIDLATGNVSIVAEGLALGAPGAATLPPTNMFNGVAVGPSGAIYVTGDPANVLYRFRAER